MPRPGKLSPEEISQEMSQLEGWSITDGKLVRDFKFDSFAEAFGFMTAAAIHAQEMDHHPDWSNSYTAVHIELISHDVGGVSLRDFNLARKIGALYE